MSSSAIVCRMWAQALRESTVPSQCCTEGRVKVSGHTLDHRCIISFFLSVFLLFVLSLLSSFFSFSFALFLLVEGSKSNLLPASFLFFSSFFLCFLGLDWHRGTLFGRGTFQFLERQCANSAAFRCLVTKVTSFLSLAPLHSLLL